MPLEYKAAAGVVAIVRYAVVGTTIKKIATRLGESGIVVRYPLYDLFGPLVSFMVSLSFLRKDPTAWR